MVEEFGVEVLELSEHAQMDKLNSDLINQLNNADGKC
jgi:hypothetical protein